MANNILAQHLFPVVERPKPLVFTNLFASTIGLFMSFVMIYYFKLGFWGLLVPTAIATIVSFLLFVKLVWIDFNIWPIIENKWKRLKEMLRIALPLVPHAFGFALLTSSARIIMSINHISYEEIGLFSHGCIMGDYATIITSALTTALVAPVQRYYRSGDYNNFRLLYYLCQGVALMSSALICLWMPEIYKLLINNSMLAQSSQIASLTCFASVALPLYSFMSITTFVEKNTKQILWLVFVPGLVNLIICSISIPIWGYKAAIYATIFSYWTQLAIPFFVKYYRLAVRLWLGSLKKILVLFVIMISTLLLSNGIGGGVLFRLVVSIILVSSFLYWYYRRRVFEVV